jgi:predicted ATPase
MGRFRVALGRFWRELKRRHVIRVVVAYAAVAWIAVQIGEATFEPLGIPDAGLTLLVVLALLGFPVAASLAWFLEVVREKPPPDREESAERVSDGAGLAAAAARAKLPSKSPPTIILDTLPAPTSPLVGRERELAEASRVVTEGEGRILTLLGTGGVGKTRLAIELAHRLAPGFRNGACFAPLGSVRSPEALPPVLAEHLGLGVTAGDDAWASTVAFLREKELLLILDNFEQLSTAAGRLGELAAGAPGLVMIVTSRERLSLHGETVLRLDGLSCGRVSGDGKLDECDAVRLFVQSARRVDGSFSLDPDSEPHVARICQLVEGLPLALELAAACVAVLSPEEIAREIEDRHDVPLGSARDAPERHQSLHAAFESSWALLDEAERKAFRRLSLFPAGFSRAAAEELGGAGLPVLAGLVNKSLVRRDPSGRYEMLDIVRQLAREKLAADPVEEDFVRNLLAEHATRVLEQVARQSDGGLTGRALEEGAREAENIRAGWSRVVQRRDYDRLGRSAAGLYRLWEARGWVHEGRELFRSAAEAVGADEPDASLDDDRRRLLAGLLARQGAFAELCDAFEEARSLLERARALLRPDEDAGELAFVLASLSLVVRADGNFEQGLALARESLELYGAAGDAVGRATALNSLGAHHYLLGQYEEAKRCYRESLEAHRSAGDTRGVWKPLNNLAGVASAEEDYDEARRLLKEVLANQRSRHNLRGVANALQNLGLVAWHAGDAAEAERWLDEGNALSREMGYRGLVAHGLTTLGAIRMARGDHDGALHAHHNAIRTACELGDLPLTMGILLDLARLHMGEGDRDRALGLLQIVRAHPACEFAIRRDADALLAEIGGEEELPAELADLPTDPMALRDVVAEILGPQAVEPL